MSWNDDEPKLFDFFLASKFPLLSQMGAFGKGPRKAWEHMAPAFAVMAIILIIVIIGTAICGGFN